MWIDDVDQVREMAAAMEEDEAFAPSRTRSQSLTNQPQKTRARRQLLLPLNDNYFCRRRVSKRAPLATAAELGNSCGLVASQSDTSLVILFELRKR